MPALRHHEPIGAEDYLAGELTSPVRHEFVNGDVFAMTGASRRHNALVGNLHVALRAHLRGTRCRVFFEAVKLHVVHDNAYYYPDLMVTCSDQAQTLTLTTDEYVVSDPVLVVEVLSPATEHIDRREKLLSYRKLPSLREYLLVAQDGRDITLTAERALLPGTSSCSARARTSPSAASTSPYHSPRLFEDIPLA